MTPDDPRRRDRFDRSYDDAIGIVSARRRKRRATNRRRHNRSLIASFLVVLGIVFVALTVGGAAGAGVAAYSVVDGLDLNKMTPDYPGVNSKIYASNGALLYKIPSPQNRTPVTSAEISPWLKKATVDIEDRRFYQHGGVDFEGIFRAAIDDINAGHVVQGASTLEQQVVRNLYLDNDPTATRKIKEAWLAMQMADEWSKDKILTTYLNIVPYGGVTYGCEAAAEVYFSKHCKDLGITQAAMIAGLPQSPTTYNPNLHPYAALLRRNDVLLAMYKNKDISHRQYVGSINKKLELDPPSANRSAGKQSYWVQYVQTLVKNEYGRKALHQGGLEIHTTLDPRLQRAAHTAMHDILGGHAGWPAAALVSIDPRTGAIRAFDATTDPEVAKFDIPGFAQRQAGSSFKPFGLMAAMMDQHIDPETMQYSTQQPLVYNLCSVSVPSCTWTVYNAESGGGGNVDLHYAMDGSINVVFARLNLDIGPEETVAMAHRLGIPKKVYLPPVPSNILGTGLVSPLNMAGAYATFASGGIRRDPLAITGIKNFTGKQIESTPADKNPGVRAIPSWAAAEMNSILKDNVTCAQGVCTGGAANLGDREAAGKTGTVESHQDAWFCGYTPVLTTCVWMGFPEGDSDAYSMIPAVGSDASFGGGYPTEIWHDFMTKAFDGHSRQFPPTPFKTPYELPAPSDWYQPFTSQFPLYTAPPPTKPDKNKNNKPGGKQTGGGGGASGGGGGGTGGGGTGGGGGTNPPPPTT